VTLSAEWTGRAHDTLAPTDLPIMCLGGHAISRLSETIINYREALCET